MVLGESDNMSKPAGALLGSKTSCRTLLCTDQEHVIRDMMVPADVLDGLKGSAVEPIKSCSQGLADRPRFSTTQKDRKDSSIVDAKLVVSGD